MAHQFVAFIFNLADWHEIFEKYLNRPGFEVWKFFNLFLFVGVLTYILRKPLSEALRERRENIRKELLKAQEERNAATAKLQEVEERLSRLNAEVEEIRTRAQREAAEERERIARTTEDEINKIREQARREIENAARTAQLELRRYAAEQSVALAEARIRQEINPEKDSQLAVKYVAALGGLKR